MKRTIYQQAIDENGANRKLREEIVGPERDSYSRWQWLVLVFAIGCILAAAWLWTMFLFMACL